MSEIAASHSTLDTRHPTPVLPYLGIWLLALAARLIYLWEIGDAPTFGLLLGDAYSYDAWARQIASGNWLGEKVFYQAPLYPYFLAAIYSVFGPSVLAAKLVQITIGAGSCLLLALATRQWFSNRIGIACGIGMTLYPAAIFSDALIQKSVLDLFLLSALLFLLGLAAKKMHLKWCMACGLVLGCLALTRENALIFTPVITLWLLLSAKRQFWPRRLIPAGMFLLALMGVLLPVALRNRAVGGTFALTTSQLGPNFYIGNHAGADGTYAPLRWGRGHPSFERTDATELAEEALGRTLNPSEVSRYWFGRAFDDIRAQPGMWLALIGRKCLLLLNTTEVGDTEDQYTHGDWSWLLKITGYPLHWGVILPMAVAGLFITWPRRRVLWLWYATLACYAASVVMFYVFARYRLPMNCFLLPLASVTLLSGRAWQQKSKRPMIGAGLIVTIIVAVISNWPLLSKTDVRAVTHNNIANHVAQDEARLSEAIEHYKTALRYKPDYAAAHFNLGVSLRRTDQHALAVARLKEAARLKPDQADTHHQLGIALAKLGMTTDAIDQYKRALQLAPNHKDAHNNIGVALAARGQLAEAARHYAQVLQIDPNHSEAHNNLGTVLARGGRLIEAKAHFQKALESNPEYRDAQYNLGKALSLLGHHREAANQFAALARAYASDGHFDRALQAGQKSLASATTAGDEKTVEAIREQMRRYGGELKK